MLSKRSNRWPLLMPGREDRAQMWSTGGTAFHTSFDERPSAHGSHLSIYNSCTNLDEQEFQVIRTIFL
ncbi:unnamed protein product, partial [Mesorhabditis belari]|uniref:Uncharacterized protein n=1 Tax=Mesorhabditis belari TaxID=2138241 RepID=A0AAF3F2E1_9BILA